MIIENAAGPSPFTSDPGRHRIVEPIITLPVDLCQTHLLPDKETANVLVQSYFINTNGLLEVFDRNEFIHTLETCYADPLSVDPSWLCLLHLTFAIGLVMAAPAPGTPEDAVIQKLKAGSIDRSYAFYLNAKRLSDPLAVGFEDAGFWSIQALVLMTVYMLAISKRNTAYAYYGMAVRSAFALGLHKEETMLIFSSPDQTVRRNLWRTLFILDRFLSASLGRPTAIHEDDCSGDTLIPDAKQSKPEQDTLPTVANIRATNLQGLQASVRTCHTIGLILQKVYSKRKISTKLAQEIAEQCKGWGQALDPTLRARQPKVVNASQGIAILHANLFHYHSIILLTRPFFVFLLSKEKKEGSQKQKRSSRMESFAEACVRTSGRSIALVQRAYEAQYLPRRNPFILYFLFAAALITLSNQFSPVARDPTANVSIHAAINIMKYFSAEDEQAGRLLDILVCFYDVVRQRRNFPMKTEEPASKGTQSLSTSMPTPREDVFLKSVSSSPQKASVLGNRPISKTETSDPNVSPTTTFRGTNLLASIEQRSMNQDSPQRSPAQTRSPHDCSDTFLDISKATSNHPSAASTNSIDGDSLPGDAEIDFQALWSWLPGNNSDRSRASAPLVPTGREDHSLPKGRMIVESNTKRDMHSGVDVHDFSESNVPPFGMTNDFKRS
ncbi:fungal-specific transcription factor domain-containing protein [Xylogone sp. PMI_703]|nr:fungal-specific transcription factor domain-containing protein [Xylogone sp. PMI_703]